MAGADVQGRFLWYDLMTTDRAAAKAFYTQVVGWETESWAGTGMPYDMWLAGHGAIGGLMELPAEVRQAGGPPHWMAHIGVRDVDATVAQVQALGGSVHKPPSDIPDVGRFAVVADPYGATFSVFTPTGDMPRPEWPQRGDFSWHELMTDDLAGAWAFYTALFGWTKMGELDMGDAGVYQMYGQGETMYGGMMKQQPAVWAFYAQVESADAAAERATSAGAQVLVGPMDVPGGDRVAFLQDPQGAVFGVHSRGA